MRRRAFWLLAVAASLGLFVAGVRGADAALMLKLESGSSSVALNDADSDGLISYFGSVGEWTLNFTVALGQPKLGTPQIHLSSVDWVLSKPIDPLYISASDTYTDVVSGFHTAFGGVTPGTAELWAYLGTSAFSEATLVGHLGPFTPGYMGAFSSAVDWVGVVPTSYFLTAKVKLSDVASGSVSSFDASVAPVPEPGTMMLFGTGLVMMAGWGRKRLHR